MTKISFFGIQKTEEYNAESDQEFIKKIQDDSINDIIEARKQVYGIELKLINSYSVLRSWST